MDNRDNESFKFTYSAEQQKEIKAIRQKYVQPQQNEDKMTQLRKLDAGVNKKAATYALIAGIFGVLLMGTGMSLAMSEFGSILGPYRDYALIIGSIIGAVGICVICIAYPLYSRILRREREKIASDVLRLTEELLK